MLSLFKLVGAQVRQRVARWCAGRVRTIADSYFYGQHTRIARVIALQRADIGEPCCSNCMHIGWTRRPRCTLEGECKWEPCYGAAELSKADFKAGCQRQVFDGWMVLDPKEQTRPMLGWARGSILTSRLPKLFRPTGISAGFFL